VHVEDERVAASGLVVHRIREEIFPEKCHISPSKADTSEDLPLHTLPTTATSDPWGTVMLRLSKQ
jgi:hypothetical protein